MYLFNVIANHQLKHTAGSYCCHVVDSHFFGCDFVTYHCSGNYTYVLNGVNSSIHQHSWNSNRDQQQLGFENIWNVAVFLISDFVFILFFCCKSQFALSRITASEEDNITY